MQTYYNPFIPPPVQEPRQDGLTMLAYILRMNGTKLGHCKRCGVESRELLCFCCGEPYGSRS